MRQNIEQLPIVRLYEFVKNKKLCRECLCKNHMIVKCKRSVHCKIYNGWRQNTLFYKL